MLPIWNEKAAFFMARYSRGGPHGQSRFPENEAKPKTGKDRKLWKIDRRTGAPFRLRSAFGLWLTIRRHRCGRVARPGAASSAIFGKVLTMADMS